MYSGTAGPLIPCREPCLRGGEEKDITQPCKDKFKLINETFHNSYPVLCCRSCLSLCPAVRCRLELAVKAHCGARMDARCQIRHILPLGSVYGSCLRQRAVLSLYAPERLLRQFPHGHAPPACGTLRTVGEVRIP